MESFIPTPLPNDISVSHIVTLHNFSYTPGFLFTGESHDFWELAFIRSGNVGVMAGSVGYTLSAGEAIFHAPGEYHNIWANGDFADVVIITFISNSPAMRFFEKRLISFNDAERNLIEKLLSLGEKIFAEPPNIVYQKKLTLKPEISFADLQLLRISLEELLIRLIQSSDIIDRKVRKSELAGNRNEQLICDSIIKKLTENIYGSLTLSDVCENVHFSKSHIKTLFKRNTGYSIMDYYTHLKLERAKILIREGDLSVSDISGLLGYSSIHYFSRLFKQKTGFSPTEYKTKSEVN